MSTIIKIPHLKVQVVVTKKRKGEMDGNGKSLDQAAGYAKYVCPGEYELHLRLPIKGKVTAGHLVHEIQHVIQYIVEDHNMSYLYEREHLAYIAGYLFEEICNL